MIPMLGFLPNFYPSQLFRALKNCNEIRKIVREFRMGVCLAFSHINRNIGKGKLQILGMGLNTFIIDPTVS